MATHDSTFMATTPKMTSTNQALINRQPNIILYDGICHLCNGSVRFINKYQHKGKFVFIALQSLEGKQLCTKYHQAANDINTILFIKDEKSYIKSNALLLILKEMGGFWRCFTILRFIPLSWRDKVYDTIARHRYRLFGKEDTCSMS